MRAKHNLIRLLRSFIVANIPLLMVIGLFAPIIGPAVDHHYADRTPDHAHVFTGEATNEHVHTFTAHDDSQNEHSDGISIVSTSASSIHSQLLLDGASLESVDPNFGNYLVAMYNGETTTPDDQRVTPLIRPPRVS